MHASMRVTPHACRCFAMCCLASRSHTPITTATNPYHQNKPGGTNAKGKGTGPLEAHLQYRDKKKQTGINRVGLDCTKPGMESPGGNALRGVYQKIYTCNNDVYLDPNNKHLTSSTWQKPPSTCPKKLVHSIMLPAPHPEQAH